MACATYQDDLLGLLEDPAGTDLDAAARHHLQRCARCHTQLADVVLMGFAVRRSMTPALDATPPDVWPRLRGRIERNRAARRNGRATVSLADLPVAAGIAIALLLPLGLLRGGGQIIHEAGVIPAAVTAAGNREAADEARHLRAKVLAGKEAAKNDGVSRARADLIRWEASPAADRPVLTRNPLSAEAR